MSPEIVRGIQNLPWFWQKSGVWCKRCLVGLWSQGTTLPSSSPAVNPVRWWDICRTRPSQSLEFRVFPWSIMKSESPNLNCVVSVSDTKNGSEVLVVGLRWNWRLSLMSGALAAECWMLKGHWPNRWFYILRLASLACPMQGSRWVNQESLNIGHSNKMMKKLSKGDSIKLSMSVDT